MHYVVTKLWLLVTACIFFLYTKTKEVSFSKYHGLQFSTQWYYQPSHTICYCHWDKERLKTESMPMKPPNDPCVRLPQCPWLQRLSSMVFHPGVSLISLVSDVKPWLWVLMHGHTPWQQPEFAVRPFKSPTRSYQHFKLEAPDVYTHRICIGFLK